MEDQEQDQKQDQKLEEPQDPLQPEEGGGEEPEHELGGEGSLPDELEEDVRAVEEELQQEQEQEPPQDLHTWDPYMLGSELLVRPLEAPKHLDKEGRIVAADAYRDKLRPEEGVVVMTGPGRTLPNGTLLPMTVQKGDRVHYGKHAGHEIKIEDEVYKVLREDEVLFGWRAQEEKLKEEPEAAPEAPSDDPLAYHPV